MTNSPGDSGPVAAGNGTAAAELRDVLHEQLEPVRDYLATMGMALAGIDQEIRSLQRSSASALAPAPAARVSDAGASERVSRQVEELRRAVQQSDGAGEDLTARIAHLAEYLEVAASHIETIRREEGGLAAIRTDVSESVIAMTNRVTTEVEALRASVTSHLTYVSSQIDAVKSANDNVAGAMGDTSGMQQQILAAVADVQDAVSAQPTQAEAATQVTLTAIHQGTSALTEVLEQLGQSVTSLTTLTEQGNTRVGQVAGEVNANRDTIVAQVGDLRTELGELAGAVAATIGTQDTSSARTTDALAEIMTGLTSIEDALGELAPVLRTVVGTEQQVGELSNQVADHLETTRSALIGDLREVAEAIDTRSDQLTAEIGQIKDVITELEQSAAAGRGKTAEELAVAQTAIIDALNTSSRVLDRRDNERVVELGNRITVVGTAVEETAAGLSALHEMVAAQDPAAVEARTSEMLERVHAHVASIDISTLQQTIEQNVAALVAGNAEQIGTLRADLTAIGESLSGADLGMIQRSVIALAEASAALESGTATGIDSIGQTLAGMTERVNALTTSVGQGAQDSSERSAEVANQIAELKNWVGQGAHESSERSAEVANQIAELKAALVGVGRAVNAIDLSEQLASARTAILEGVEGRTAIVEARVSEGLDSLGSRVVEMGRVVNEADAALEGRLSQLIIDRDGVLEGRLGQGLQGVEAQVSEVRRITEQLNSALAALAEGLAGEDVATAVNTAQAAIVAVVDERARNLDARSGHRIDGIEERLAAVIDGITRLSASLGTRDVDAARDAILAAVGQGSEAVTTRSDALTAEVGELKAAVVGLGRSVNAIQVSDELAALQAAIIDAVGQVGERAGQVDSRVSGLATELERIVTASLRDATSSEELTAALTQARDAILGALGEGSAAVSQGVTGLDAKVAAVVQEVEQVASAVDSVSAALAAQNLAGQLAVVQEAIVAAVDERARTLDGRTGRRIEQIESRMTDGVAAVASAVAALDPDMARAAILSAVGESAEALNSRTVEIASEIGDLKSALVGVGRAVNAIDLTGDLDTARQAIVADVETRLAGVTTELANLSAAMGGVASAFGEEDMPAQLGAMQAGIVEALDERARTLDRLSRNRVEPLNQRLNDLVSELDRVRSSLTEQMANVGEIVQDDERHRTMTETLDAIAHAVASSRNEILAAATRAANAATSVRDDVVNETEQGISRVMNSQAELQERLAEVSRSSVVALDRATSIANQLVPNIDGLAEVAMERTASVERRLDQLLSRLQPDASTIGIAMADAMRQAVGPLLSDVLARVDALTEAEQRHSAEVSAMRSAVEALGAPVARRPQQPARPVDEEEPAEPPGRRRRR